MRRISIVGVAALSVLALLPAAPVRAQVGLYADAEQMADATWIRREGTSKVMYFALAYRGIVGGGAPLTAIGVVGKGECESGHGWTFCFGSGRGRRLDGDSFAFDPAMSSAYMRLEMRGHRHEVTWTGEDLMYPGVGAQAGLAYAAAYGGAWRPASVEAELYGHRLRGRSFFNGLSQGGGAFLDAYVTRRGYTFHEDGTISLRLRFRQ